MEEIDMWLNNKIVGKVRNNMYVSIRNSTEHYFIKGKGYPISIEILEKLVKLKVEKIKLIVFETKQTCVYVCDIQKYLSAPTFQELGWEAQKCPPVSELECFVTWRQK